MKKVLSVILLGVALIGGAVEIVKGTPGEMSWEKVPSMKFFRWKEAGDPPMATYARFMYDDNQLYIRIFCTEPNISEARSKPVLKRDANVWDNDCVEIFIDLCDNTSRIYQFVCDIHNVNAELVWNDPKFAKRITWNGYWHSKVHYFDTSFTVDVVIPWRSLGITSAKGRQIAINLNRYRTIHPWGRYVLAEKTEKLLDTSKFFRFGPLNITAPALRGKAAPASAAIAGKNELDWEIVNVGAGAVQGEVLLVAVTPGGDRILAREKVNVGGRQQMKKSFSYTMMEVGTFPVKLVFTGKNGKSFDLWADSFVFNSPLDFAHQFLSAVEGEDFALFVRNYLPVKPYDITVEISGSDGKTAVTSKQRKQGKEFYLNVPCGKLKAGRYQVNVKCGEFRQTLKLLVVPALL